MTSLLDRDASPRARLMPSPDDARVLLGVAFRPSGILLAVVSVVVVLTLVLAGSDLTGTFGALAGTWLAVHQVPLGIAGATLSLLPILPTALLVRGVARQVARAVTPSSSRRDVVWVVAAALAGPLAMAVVMLAMIGDASTVIAMSTPGFLATVGWVLLVHGLGAALGCVRGTWPTPVHRLDLPAWALAAAGPAARAGAVLVAGGAVTVVVSLVLSMSTMGAVLDAGGGVGGALGLTALSVLYLPNVVVAAASVVTGASASAGVVSVSVFESTGGDLPAVPVLAALPESSAQIWWPVLLVVPAVAAIVLGRAAARATATLPDALRAASLAAVLVALGCAVVSAVSGGVVGTFGHFGADIALFAVTAFTWCLVVGVVAAGVAAYVLRRHDVHGWDDPVDQTADRDRASTPSDAVAALPAGSATEPTDDADTTDVPEPADTTEPAETTETEVDTAETVPAESGKSESATTAASETTPTDVVDAEVVDLPDEPKSTGV
ncbi:cell division protein PerM [Rhodococcoides corynebacterioides]|uniref:cell division protein PerM n=1 Tax=Rhodococcoides corynebacterioides TaxID=53972 RepID=UPI001C9AF13D|nr:DUF6350 family protein [Rhodococcus corynebacterioides]MBY6361911.1 hypothetical protein [Rhodococcus corynebacterioides]